jgi:hypothetical protein
MRKPQGPIGILVAVAGIGGACRGGGPAPPTDPVAALDAGQPRAALDLLGVAGKFEPDLGPLSATQRAVFVAAALDLERWGDAERGLGLLTTKVVHDLLSCYLQGKRGDILAERFCREAIDAAGKETGAVPPFALDSAHLGLTISLDLNNRVEAAEAVLRERVAARPVVRTRKALVDFHERVGWVKEGVDTLEAWYRDTPGDKALRDRLLRLLDRKVRGDILEKRGEEAEKSARRGLELDPGNGTWRWFLADALELLGRTEETAREREAAKASGAPQPKSPSALPGTH